MDVTGVENYTETDIDSGTKTDELLCDLQRTTYTNMLDNSGYEYLEESSGTTDTGDADCSGMGETWGPGIGPPPDGCERRL
jgi:hypothetical protein